MAKVVSHTLKTLWGSVASLILIALFIFFLVDQRQELMQVPSVLKNAQFGFLVLGLGLMAFNLIEQGNAYRASLRVLGKSISLLTAVRVFLQRFFLSSFIPAGFTVSQYAFSREFKKYEISEMESHLSSTIYLLFSAIAYVLFLLPTLLILLLTGRLTPIEWYGSLVVVAVTIIMMIELGFLFQEKGLAYDWLKRVMPDLPAFIQSWKKKSFSRRTLVSVLLHLILVHISSIALLFVVFLALGVPASLFTAIIGYVVAQLVLTLTPIFQGLGVVEFSLVYMLMQLGIVHEQALTVTLLFRLFQLWLPFLLGLSLVVRQRWLRFSL